MGPAGEAEPACMSSQQGVSPALHIALCSVQWGTGGGGDSAPSSLSLCSQGIGNVRHSPAPAWRHGVPHVTTLFTVSSLDVWCVVLGEYLIQHV